MKKIKILSIYSISLAVLFGCTAIDESKVEAKHCTSKWYTLTENQISTGDDQGHGPDLGSIEWRSVIEFKLEIRDNAQVPPLESEQWCKYINELFIKKLHNE